MIAVIISANSEWKAALEYLDPVSLLRNPYSEHFFSEIRGKSLVFIHGGWGKVSAAATAQYCIDAWNPELIINLGTCGGLDGGVRSGETLLVNETVMYDIYERMADPEEAIRFYSTKLDLSFIREPYPQSVHVGPLASADQDIDPKMVPILKEKFKVGAADWESAAIAWVARKNDIPCLILRTVSDVVSEAGGEIYDGDAVQFKERSHVIMRTLLNALPEWIGRITIPS